MENYDLIRKMKDGQKLIITGGSPLKQDGVLFLFLFKFITKYGFKPTIEIENECVFMPSNEIIELVDVWNNSPKLSNSGNSVQLRYNPAVLQTLSSLKNSWFKFVITGESDWDEIQQDFIDPGHIKKSQVVLMPVGGHLKELEQHRQLTVQLAIENNVRYCTREHVVLWGQATGV